MKGITAVATVELTNVFNFKDSPSLCSEILNNMDEVRTAIIEEVKKQNPLADNVNVKVQFFVNDSGDADSEKRTVTILPKKTCRNCRHFNNCFGDDTIVALKCQFDGFSYFVPDDKAND